MPRIPLPEPNQVYKHNDSNDYYRIRHIVADTVYFFPAGGGFEGSCNIDLFMMNYIKQDIPEEYVSASFHIPDCDRTVWAGYLKEGHRWNGWQIPYMTRDTIDQLMESPLGSNMTHKWDDDVLVMVETIYGEDEQIRVEPTDIGGMPHYSMGNGWCWELVDEPEPEPVKELPGRCWQVAYTFDVDHIEVFESYQDAKDRYDQLVGQDDLHSASITVVIESTDYEVHPLVHPRLRGGQ